ncbi:MAG: hypothetical protein WAL67_06810 [Candidatus Cybelea sp.]
MTREDRVKALLADEKLSYRAIAREVGCSDWLVRRISREEHWRPMKSTHDETVGIAVWVGLAATVAAIALRVLIRLSVSPPTDPSSASFDHTNTRKENK